MQVVHTTFTLSKRSKKVDTYQYTANTNTYEDGGSLPAAVFSYDVSPMQVTRGRVRAWHVGGPVRDTWTV